MRLTWLKDGYEIVGIRAGNIDLPVSPDILAKYMASDDEAGYLFNTATPTEDMLIRATLIKLKYRYDTLLDEEADMQQIEALAEEAMQIFRSEEIKPWFDRIIEHQEIWFTKDGKVCFADTLSKDAIVELMWEVYEGDFLVSSKAIEAIEEDNPLVKELVEEFIESVRGGCIDMYGLDGVRRRLERLSFLIYTALEEAEESRQEGGNDVHR